MRLFITLLLGIWGLASCSSPTDKSTAGEGESGDSTPDTSSPSDDCDPDADADSDGIDDCTEEDLGLDPSLDDTDGDGFSDGVELNCGSDALDPNDTCVYTCGWGQDDPGNIEATGSGLGDVMENISLVDQCGDMVNLYDFAGAYHILYMTAAF